MFHRVSYEHQIKEKISISDQTHLRLYNCYRDVHKACIVLHANFLFLIPRSEFHASSCVDPTSSYVNDLNLLILTQRRGWIHALSLHHQKPNVVVSHRRSPQVSALHSRNINTNLVKHNHSFFIQLSIEQNENIIQGAKLSLLFPRCYNCFFPFMRAIQNGLCCEQ